MAVSPPSKFATNFRNPVAWLSFALTTLAGIFLDLWTKKLASASLDESTDYPFLNGLLHFTFVKNWGAVFGLGQGGRWLFILVSITAIIFVGYLFAKAPRYWWYHITLGMLLAGIMGNLYDRIFFGYVRDMIHALPCWPHFFPWVFNVAD